MTKANLPATHFWEHLYEDTDECLIWPYGASAAGYGQILLAGRRHYVHSLACIAYHGPRPPGMEAAHGPCHNPRCWNGRHLSWKTPGENQLDKVRDGTLVRGERCNLTRLTADQVLMIRASYARGGVSQSQLAEQYEVKRANISAILLRRSWKHI